MSTSFTAKSLLQVLGIPLAIMVFSVILALSQSPNMGSVLSTAIILDLVLTAPLVYLILIWKKNISKATVIRVIGLGLIIASVVIPENQSQLLAPINSLILPLLELFVVYTLMQMVSGAAKTYRSISDNSTDHYFLIKESIKSVISNKRFADVIATEVGMVYYAFFGWTNKAGQRDNEFTGYKENGIIAILFAIALILLVEAFGMHLLLIRWNSSLAWVLLALSIYTVIQLLGHINALKGRYSTVGRADLYLKHGLFGDLKVDFKNIEKIEFSSRDIENGDKKVEKLAFPKGLQDHNVIMYLNDTMKIEKLYGIKTECDVLLFYVDNVHDFEKILKAKNKLIIG